eukprot:493703-Rhodomonas_salina.1
MHLRPPCVDQCRPFNAHCSSMRSAERLLGAGSALRTYHHEAPMHSSCCQLQAAYEPATFCLGWSCLYPVPQAKLAALSGSPTTSIADLGTLYLFLYRFKFLGGTTCGTSFRLLKPTTASAGTESAGTGTNFVEGPDLLNSKNTRLPTTATALYYYYRNVALFLGEA